MLLRVRPIVSIPFRSGRYVFDPDCDLPDSEARARLNSRPDLYRLPDSEPDLEEYVVKKGMVVGKGRATVGGKAPYVARPLAKPKLEPKPLEKQKPKEVTEKPVVPDSPPVEIKGKGRSKGKRKVKGDDTGATEASPAVS